MAEGLNDFFRPVERDVKVRVSVDEFVSAYENILASHVLPVVLSRVINGAERNVEAYSPAEPPRQATECLEKYTQMQRLLDEIRKIGGA